MEQVYIFLGQLVVILLLSFICVILLAVFWNINKYYYTWLYQVYDYYAFILILKNKGDLDYHDLKKYYKSLLEVFNTPGTRMSRGLFSKKVIKLIEKKLEELDYNK